MNKEFWTVDKQNPDNPLHYTQEALTSLTALVANHHGKALACNAIMGALLQVNYAFGVTPEKMQAVLCDIADKVPEMWVAMDAKEKSDQGSVH